MVKAKLIIARVAAANVIPPILAQKNSQKMEEQLNKKNRIPQSKL